MVRTELRNLRDSCRQVGADRMAFICEYIEREGVHPETDGFRQVMEVLHDEGYGLMHDMRAYAIKIKHEPVSQLGTQRPTHDSAIARRNHAGSLTDFADLRQLYCRTIHCPPAPFSIGF